MCTQERGPEKEGIYLGWHSEVGPRGTNAPGKAGWSGEGLSQERGASLVDLVGLCSQMLGMVL